MAHTHSTDTHHPTPAPGATEPDATDLRSIVGFAVGLFVVALVSHLAMLLMFRVMDNQQIAAEPPRVYPLAIPDDQRRPPEPRLQGGVHSDVAGRMVPPAEAMDQNAGPKEALIDLRAEEQSILDNYSWVDRNNRVVHIPIDQAMKLTLQRGLPARSAAPAAAGQATPEEKKEPGK